MTTISNFAGSRLPRGPAYARRSARSLRTDRRISGVVLERRARTGVRAALEERDPRECVPVDVVLVVGLRTRIRNRRPAPLAGRDRLPPRTDTRRSGTGVRAPLRALLRESRSSSSTSWSDSRARCGGCACASRSPSRRGHHGADPTVLSRAPGRTGEGLESGASRGRPPPHRRGQRRPWRGRRDAADRGRRAPA